MAAERRLPEELEAVRHRLILDRLLRRKLRGPLPLDLLMTEGGVADEVHQNAQALGRVTRQDADRDAEVILVDEPIDRRAERFDLEGDPLTVATGGAFDHDRLHQAGDAGVLPALSRSAPPEPDAERDEGK